jgi:hypothetical protein
VQHQPSCPLLPPAPPWTCPLRCSAAPFHATPLSPQLLRLHRPPLPCPRHHVCLRPARAPSTTPLPPQEVRPHCVPLPACLRSPAHRYAAAVTGTSPVRLLRRRRPPCAVCDHVLPPPTSAPAARCSTSRLPPSMRLSRHCHDPSLPQQLRPHRASLRPRLCPCSHAGPVRTR